MRRGKTESDMALRVATDNSVPVSEVYRAVSSFFGVIKRDSRSLPFDDPTRIYTRERFGDYVKVRSVPFIGRMGPVYSRYLKWRGNEARNIKQAMRSDYRSRVSQNEIDSVFLDVSSGKTPEPVRKLKFSEMYKRVWMVGRVGKRLARQVIPNEKENV